MRIAVAAALLALAACAEVGPRDPLRPSTPSDRSAIDLAEVVVTVRTEKGPQNLHVWFAILIQPTEGIREREVRELEGILRRTEGRIAAQATADLAGRASIPTSTLGELRAELVGAAQKTLDAAIERWRFRRSFRLEAAITSIYFTDGSVGRERAAPHWW